MNSITIPGTLWRVAPQDWAIRFEPWFLPMYSHVLEHLQLRTHHMLLDAGCGSGLFTSMAIDEGAQVIGVDISAGLLAVAKSRNPLNNFMNEDLESLPFASNSFHLVSALNSLQFVGNFDRALKETARVLRPGGKMAIGIWDKPQNSDATIILKAIGKLLPAPLPETPGPFALSGDGRVENALENCGLRLTYKTVVTCPFLYNSLKDAVRCFMETGPAAAAMNFTSRMNLENAVRESLEAFELTDGFHFLRNQFLVFIAEK